jgi:hypothetical protein
VRMAKSTEKPEKKKKLSNLQFSERFLLGH